MEVKYESLCGGWCSNAMHGSHRVGVLKNMRRVDFSKLVRFEVGDQFRIQFWHDGRFLVLMETGP